MAFVLALALATTAEFLLMAVLVGILAIAALSYYQSTVIDHLHKAIWLFNRDLLK